VYNDLKKAVYQDKCNSSATQTIRSKDKCSY